MIENHITLLNTELHEKLLPVLIGKVFHVTSLSAYKSILRDGAIRNNANGQFPFSYEVSEKSYHRLRGRVSLIDLRNITIELVTTGKYNFLNPRNTGDNPVYLFINESLHAKLIDSTACGIETGYREKVVPLLEAGYQGDIPIDMIEGALIVTIEPDPDQLASMQNLASALHEALKKP